MCSIKTGQSREKKNTEASYSLEIVDKNLGSDRREGIYLKTFLPLFVRINLVLSLDVLE